MATTVICPNCKTQFEPEAAIAQAITDQMKKEYNLKWKELERQKDEEFKKKENEWRQQQEDIQRRQEEEKKTIENRLRDELQKAVGADFENRLKLAEDSNRINEEKLRDARSKELEFLKKMQEIKTKEEEMELSMQRRLQEERSRLSELIKKEEEERNRLRDEAYEMKLKEREKQLDDQRRLIEEMKRKSEQGSMQLQGEVQELALEQLLRHTFPIDLVSEVGKGVRGADCILTVRNNFGQECGKIIFESKRTKDFGGDWIEKLKADGRTLGADILVLVTQAMPRDMDCFGEKDGVWICNFGEVRALVHVLRDLLLRVHNAAKKQENKGDKMTLMYNYLTSQEFLQQWIAITEVYSTMKISIQKEREQMERMWKARERQLEKALTNATHVRGSIEGIAGMDVDLNLLPEEDNNLLLD